MSLEEVLRILRNRLATLGLQRSHAASVGDLERVSAIDEDILSTEQTIARIESLV
jgi:hypothetical protein